MHRIMQIRSLIMYGRLDRMTMVSREQSLTRSHQQVSTTEEIKEVFGTDDPDEVGKLFKDYPTILETAQTLKDAGYRIFSSDAEMNVFSGDSAWVVDGTLNVDQSRIDYMDLCVDLYQNDLTAYASQCIRLWLARYLS